MATAYRSLAAKRIHVYLHQLRSSGVLVRLLKQKDLKKLLAYSSLAHVGLIAAGTDTLLSMDYAVLLQMIAQVCGSWTVFISEIILEDMKPNYC
jgi:NADH-quinone oxidoreductase subunit M